MITASVRDKLRDHRDLTYLSTAIDGSTGGDAARRDRRRGFFFKITQRSIDLPFPKTYGISSKRPRFKTSRNLTDHRPRFKTQTDQKDRDLSLYSSLRMAPSLPRRLFLC